MNNKLIIQIGIFAALAVAIFLIFWLNTDRVMNGVGSDRVDSLITEYEKLPEGKYEVVIAREQVNAYVSGNMSDYYHITEYFQERADKDNNRIARSYIKSNKANFLLNENKPDSALALAREALAEAEGSTSVGLGNIYNTIANSFYHLGHQDSAKYYMTKGYLFATTQKIDVFIMTFGINLGTLYYGNRLFGAASYYFQTALEASKRVGSTPLMLINNITSILSVERKYAEADSIWNIYIAEMEKEEDPYEHQMFFVNRTLHLQTMERWKESRRIFSEYQPEEIFDVIRISFLRALLSQTLHDKPDEAAGLLRKYRSWIGERYVPAITELFDELHEVISKNPDVIPMDSILIWEKNHASELKDNPKAISNSNIIKALIAYKKGNASLAYEFMEKSRLSDAAFEEINDSLRYADFMEKNQLNKLKEDVNIANLKVEQAEKEKKYVNYLWILSLVVLVGLIVVLLLVLSYRKAKLEYAMEQIHFMKTEESHLMKEQELNTRIVNLSQLIVLKAQDLGKKIKLVSSDDKETLADVKKEIEELSRLGIEDKPQLADKLIDDYQVIFDKFPDFAAIANLTEKRIFILSIDGYKPKEIANVVGVSIQYVHNVRTRLRKKLNIANSVEWESLKNG